MTVSCQISLCLPSAVWGFGRAIIQYYSCFLNDRERIENFAFYRIFGFALGQKALPNILPRPEKGNKKYSESTLNNTSQPQQ